jgi:hypothetical protein
MHRTTNATPLVKEETTCTDLEIPLAIDSETINQGILSSVERRMVKQRTLSPQKVEYRSSKLILSLKRY